MHQRSASSASSDGGERTVSAGLLLKPDDSEAPIAAASFASGGAAPRPSPRRRARFEVGDDVIIAGRHHNGRWAAASAAHLTFTINKVYVAEIVPTDPPLRKSAISRLPTTFEAPWYGSAKFYKTARNTTVQDVTIDIDMDLTASSGALATMVLVVAGGTRHHGEPYCRLPQRDFLP